MAPSAKTARMLSASRRAWASTYAASTARTSASAVPVAVDVSRGLLVIIGAFPSAAPPAGACMGMSKPAP